MQEHAQIIHICRYTTKIESIIIYGIIKRKYDDRSNNKYKDPFKGEKEDYIGR